MKSFSVLLAVGLAASAKASQLALCSAECLADSIIATGCKASSTDCICRSDVFMSSVTECVEKRCAEDDKLPTLETAQQLCSTTSMHGQLKKRESDAPTSEPAATTVEKRWSGWSGWWGSRFFGGPRGRGRPHWGWGKPKPTATVTVSAAQPTATPKPVDWVPNFKSGSQDWWKQQSAEWWKANGYDWWRANGYHFYGPQWYWGKTEQWWETNGNRWWQGPSNSRPGNWRGGRPWWPTAPAVTQPEPVKPTATPTYTPSDDQAWEDWPGWPSTWPENNAPSGPTPTPDPTKEPWQGWQGWTPAQPTDEPQTTSTPTHTHIDPTWTPYTTTKPVQTVIPTGW